MAASLRLPQGFGAFWSWWRGELAALLPARLRGGGAPTAWRLEGHDAQLALDLGGEARYLIDPEDGDLDRPPGLRPPAGPVLLRIDAGLAVLQRVELPLAAEENLRQVLTYQMDRETPFTAEQVRFDYRIADRDRVRQQLVVDLVVLPRRLLDAVLERLRRWGVAVRAAEVAVPGGASFDLLPPEYRAAPRRVPRVVNGVLAVLALALLGAGVALPLWDKQSRIAELEPQLAEARRAALVANGLKDEIAAAIERLDFAVQQKRVGVKLLDVLQEITRLLPDEGWLQEMEVHGNEITLRGETPNAAQLLGLLEASNRLQNARFRAPVVPAPGSDRERFLLSVDLRDGGAP